MMVRFDEMAVSARRLIAVGGVGLVGVFSLTACGGEGEADTSADAAAETATVDESTAETEGSVSYGDGSSVEAPLAPGSEISLEDWTVTVDAVGFDASEVILAEDSTNEGPGEGEQFAMISLTGTYSGEETGWLFLSAEWSLWIDGEQYEEFPEDMLPEDLSLKTTENGETVSGNVAIVLPEGDYDSAVVNLVGLTDLQTDGVFVAVE